MKLFGTVFIQYKNLSVNDKSYSKYAIKIIGIDKTTKILNIPVL